VLPHPITGGRARIADLLAMPGVEDSGIDIHRSREPPRPADLS
jgi:hypothetical protein